ncbi:MAG: hypothetical protein ACYCUF_02215 [Acidimicrobiales bacterium]|jgi:hypothetical protein|nr:hypothetical protein [Actinomycetota bacterium]
MPVIAGAVSGSTIVALVAGIAIGAGVVLVIFAIRGLQSPEGDKPLPAPRAEPGEAEASEVPEPEGQEVAGAEEPATAGEAGAARTEEPATAGEAGEARAAGTEEPVEAGTEEPAGTESKA